MPKQHLKFSELYISCKERAERTLATLWCGETGNESQKDYARQIRELISKLFAPETAVPMVECLNRYKGVNSVSADEAKNIVGGLWTKSFAPYEHQYQCWNTVLKARTDDGKYKSFVVTTGTGSGKTECFMLPLVHDLRNQPQREVTEAIFLYPLNALMEDQKDRLEELLAETDLRYCVYNGDLPEKEPKPDEHSEYDESVRRKIDMIRGIVRDKDGKEIERKYKHCIATRDELRKHPAEILLTNPTMLEYILLRTKDSSLIAPKSLRWMVIDETHTYTGAGAAEMAILLRRLLLAFDLTASEIRFATSSATLGNAKTEEERIKMTEDLRKFISDLTGLELNQIEVVGGNRKGEETVPDNEDAEVWRKLVNATNGYVSLSELILDGKSVVDKLNILDEMCDRLPEKTDLKVKVHFFFRVPNNGLFVKLSELEGGSFKIYTEKPTDDRPQDAPLIELSRCKHCGEYVAIAQINKRDSSYGPITMDDSDMFELEPDEDEQSDKFIFAVTNKKLEAGDNNSGYRIIGDKFIEAPGSMNEDGGWRVIANTQNRCPHCSTKLTKTIGDGESEDSIEEEDGKKLQKFRFSVDLISRIIAPEILDQLAEADDTDGLLHKGQQYISFVDSRQGAARGSLGQNLEQERMWAYSRIFHALNHKALLADDATAKIKELEEKLDTLNPRKDRDKVSEILDEIERLESIQGGELTWAEITKLLEDDPISDMFARQFAKRTANSDELDIYGNALPLVKRRYIQSIMVEFLGKRPLHSASPETMGLFTTSYPHLKKSLTDELPEAVTAFNELIQNPENRISNEDWHNLLQVFLDYNVRSNESIFLRLRDDDPLDIKSCIRFSTQRQRRRTVHKPSVTAQMPSRVIRFITELLVDDGLYGNQKDALRNESELIQSVIDALWIDLTEKYNILEHGTQYNQEKGSHVKDRDDTTSADPVPWRLNVANLSFKLFDKVALCDTNTNGSELSAKRLRPINVWFKDFSPYLKNRSHVMRISPDSVATWTPFCGVADEKELEKWAENNRSLLWNNGLWGEGGVFSERLNTIYLTPDTFIQAEHTAQVDKMISRQVQRDFKKHLLNILACSTTMEMGVDLGDLELVMMSSVPPQPSNYKQRAGRSGRNNYVKSVAITLCGSDAVGLRTQLNPDDNIISRKVNSPDTDLTSAQVIQRHVNAFLVREFGVFSMSSHAGSINQKVADYYTPFEYGREGDHVNYFKENNEKATPVDGLGNQKDTPYERFNDSCANALDPELRRRLEILLRGTCFESRVERVVQKAREANERCYDELEWKIEDISITYKGDISNKYRNFLTVKFLELLDEQLLGFWATNRFTPNANMPVNVVAFDVNSGVEQYYKASTTSNPSYSLRDALQQYAPGNSVVIDGRVNIVRGLRYTGFFKRNVTFKTLYHNSQQTVIDARNDISDLVVWPVNQEVGLEMIQPTEFLPDINETENRIIANNIYTRVNAQLIGASEWGDVVTEPHLFSFRSSKESGSAKILYYNDGLGHGYCHCTRCGRTVLESIAANSERKLERLPSEFNNIPSDNEEQPDYHYEIAGAQKNHRCAGSNRPESIKRNIILGDLIQTDYTEIRIRRKGDRSWINRITEENKGLLTTLGLVFSRSLAEILGKDTSAIGFTLTPNAHICIFDTNPGGAGYSNQLADMDMIKTVIQYSSTILQAAERTKSKDMLLDKFSMHYLEDLDIPDALKWIEEENLNAVTIPNEVRGVVGSSASESSLTRIQRAVVLCEGEVILFVDNDYSKWNYGDSDGGWRGNLLNYFHRKGEDIKFVIIENAEDTMNEPVKEMAREIKSWTRSIGKMSNPLAGKDIYPLAYLNGKLYLTNNPEFSTLNEKWGNGTVFVADYDLDLSEVENVDLRYRSTTSIVKLYGDKTSEISSMELGATIESEASSIFNEFFSYCRKNSSPIKITYQDEHLKSVMGIILTLQTIGYFIEKIGKPFSVEFLIEKYQDIQRRPGMAVNLPNYGDRDLYLEGLSRKWLESLDISGSIVPVVSRERNTLTHWRELSIECAGKKLSIYPDGGLMNGWSISRNNHRYFDPTDVDASTEVLLTRNQDIKIDVTIENV